MPLPAWLARLNRRLANPLLRPVAGRLPYFGVVLHRGRRSGRLYRTPVNAFPDEGGVWVALTYGRDVDWVKNVLAAGGCRILHRARRIDLVRPRLYEMPDGPFAIPGSVRLILRGLRVRHYLRLERESAHQNRSGA